MQFLRIFNKNKLFFFTASFFMTFLPLQAVEVSFRLNRAKMPHDLQITQALNDQSSRKIKKHIVTGSCALGAVALMYAAYQMQEYFKTHDQEEFVKKIQKAQIQTLNFSVNNISEVPKISGGLLSPLWFVTDNVKDFVWTGGKYLSGTTQTFVSGIILTSFFNYAQNKVSQVYQDETILWYVSNKTKIIDILNDIKSYSVEYDLYSTLLSVEVLNQDVKMHVKAFVGDLVQTVKDYENNDVFKDKQYFQFLVDGLKRKYVAQSREYEKIQEYIIPYMSLRKRALADGSCAQLFTRDCQRKTEIAQLCNLFVEEIEKVISFISIQFKCDRSRLTDIIQACNSYIAKIEEQLNASLEQLDVLSKADRGMFTCSYEYEKLLFSQINYLHRYCKMVS